LGYIKMVSGGTDFEGQQKALRSILNTPNRFFVAPDAAKAAVDQALREYASMERMPIKNVDPMEALGDDRFRRSLAHALTKIDRPRSRREEFKLSKTVEKLDAFWEEVADLRETAQAEETTTHQLFDAVLSVSGIELEVDPNTGRITGEKPVTFREAVSNNLKDQGGEDDDAGAEDEDSSMQGLGNISFLYELAKPDPNDPADKAADPRTPFGFRAKMERIKERAKELRYDITAWDKQQEAKPPEERQPPPGVYLGTVHSTKGAQWKNTFVQMPAGKFPFQPPAKPGSEPPPPEVIEKEMQQERRLGYVAITRAIDNLTILCQNEVNGKPAGVSPFVAEAGLHLGENIGAEPTSPEEEPPGEPSKEASDDSGSDWDGYEADYERS
jgi:superfamily I DNA/RNA helicase